jgi:EAL domain-containing protein (putative c-di-GMP-specific phosphodiesterase class I)
LAQVGRRLRAVVPPRGTVARWGGDVFAVLIAEAASAGEIVELAQRILASVAAEPFRAADRSVTLSASVGVALADGSPAGYVWRNADAAVSRAKESGGGRLEIVPSVPHPDARRHLSLAAQLGRAFGPGQLGRGQHREAEPARVQDGEPQPGEDRPGQAQSGAAQSTKDQSTEDQSSEDQPGRAQLTLEYRPIADLASSRIIGAEGVPRWRGDGGSVPRQEFMAAAETARVAAELGDWMLRECCSQVADWRRDGWQASLWLQCPATSMMAPFGASVLEALADSGLAPAALILEVAPEVLAEGGEVVLRGLGELRERGVRLAVDISAAGYGSLARLSHHPVDLVRIGPDLVAGLGVDAAAETLIRALVRIGKDLGIPVAADGIERAEQRDLLAAMGCVLGMGTFVAGPVPPASIPVLSAEHGPVSEHGLAGGNRPADGELPFGDVISPASHLAS